MLATDETSTQSSARYAGANTLRYLYTVITNLNLIRWRTGNEWSSRRSGVMWWNLMLLSPYARPHPERPVTSIAARHWRRTAGCYSSQDGCRRRVSVRPSVRHKSVFLLKRLYVDANNATSEPRDTSCLMPKILTKFKRGHPNGGAKYRWNRLNTGEVAENWRLSSWRIVSLAWSQVHHTEHPLIFGLTST